MPAKKTEVATTEKKSLLTSMASARGMDPGKFYNTLKATAFKEAKTDEQFAAMLMVAQRHNLDPITREFYAFPDSRSGGVIPVIGFDGWMTIANRNAQYDGYDLKYADKHVRVEGCPHVVPEWVEAVVYRKDRSHPATSRCVFAQSFRKTPAWTGTPLRMMEQKALAQAIRRAFGMSGLYEPDEAELINTVVDTDAPKPSSSAARAREALKATPTPTEAEDAPETFLEGDDEVTVDVETGQVYVGDVEEAEVEDVGPPATKQQVTAIHAAKRDHGWSDEAYDLLLAEYDVGHARDLSREQATEVVRTLMAGPEAQEEML